MFHVSLNIYLFIYNLVACGILVVARILLSYGMHTGSSSPTRDRAWAACIGSTESYPLDHQGSPPCFIKSIHNNDQIKGLNTQKYKTIVNKALSI